MKKEYSAPVVEVTKFDVEDVITASGLVQGDNNSVNYNDLFN